MTLDDLRKIAENATKGPWEWERPSEDDFPQHDQSLVTTWKEDDGHPATVLHSWGYDASGIEAEPQDRLFIATFNPQKVLELLTRLAAVEKLHAPGNIVDVWGKSRTMADDFQVCRECTDPDNNWVAWPCETIKAARGE